MEIDGLVRSRAAAQYGVVSRRQLFEMGLTRSAVTHRVANGMLTPVTRRVLVLAGTPPLAAQAAMVAVLDAPSGSFLSHRSAAAWWGLPGFDLHGRLEVTVPRRGAPRETEAARWHYQHPIPDHAVCSLRGLTVAAPALMLMHLGAVCHEGRVRRALNNSLARGIVGLAALRALREELAGSGRNGVGVLGSILEEINDDYVPTDSGVELRLSELADHYGVALERQVWVGEANERIGRADFRLKTEPNGLIELLSFTYHAMFLDRLEDEKRFRRMRRAGFEVLRVWDVDVWNRPDHVGASLIRFSMELAGQRLRAR
ncbi:MAG TPA: hypothetical protein VHL52_06705 [Acidimicrobiia bacterium]|nr:hypothetical protein [Acidimicrobiia bacterium]